jgi:uncharacterized membrane protein YdjX (TVP38/TMEM64 family)
LKNILIPFIIAVTLVVLAFVLFPGIETFFTGLLDRSRHDPGRYTLFSFLALSSDIVLPVPSSIVMYTNGYVLGAIGGTALSVLSLMVSSCIGYFLGLYSSYGFRRNEDAKASLILRKYGDLAILITRGIPVLAESVCIVCGYGRMNFSYYLLLNLAGYIPLSLLYAAFGSLGYSKDLFLLSFGCAVLISGLFWFFGRRFLRGSSAVDPVKAG